DRLDESAKTFERIASEKQVNALAPYAYLAAARVHLDRRDLPAELRVLDALLIAFPAYQVDVSNCRASPVILAEDLCFGAESIAARANAIRAFLKVQAKTDLVLADPRASTLRKATGWYELGRAWEEKDAI